MRTLRCADVVKMFNNFHIKKILREFFTLEHRAGTREEDYKRENGLGRKIIKRKRKLFMKHFMECNKKICISLFKPINSLFSLFSAIHSTHSRCEFSLALNTHLFFDFVGCTVLDTSVCQLASLQFVDGCDVYRTLSWSI